MKLPEKIYIQSEKDYYLCREWSEKLDNGLENTEYVQKEALQKWLMEQLGNAESDPYDEYASGQRVAYLDVINKLKQM